MVLVLIVGLLEGGQAELSLLPVALFPAAAVKPPVQLVANLVEDVSLGLEGKLYKLRDEYLL